VAAAKSPVREPSFERSPAERLRLRRTRADEAQPGESGAPNEEKESGPGGRAPADAANAIN